MTSFQKRLSKLENVMKKAGSLGVRKNWNHHRGITGGVTLGKYLNSGFLFCKMIYSNKSVNRRCLCKALSLNIVPGTQ